MFVLLLDIFRKIFFSVYDITNRSTILSIQRWVEEVRRYTSSHVLLLLIGNTRIIFNYIRDK